MRTPIVTPERLQEIRDYLAQELANGIYSTEPIEAISDLLAMLDDGRDRHDEYRARVTGILLRVSEKTEEFHSVLRSLARYFGCWCSGYPHSLACQRARALLGHAGAAPQQEPGSDLGSTVKDLQSECGAGDVPSAEAGS